MQVSKTKQIAIMGVYVALLIGGQLALSMISGVEIVTVLLAGFAYYFGIKKGLVVASAFSILRCFLFGFFPNVIILYLVYYNLFVVVFGALGLLFKGETTPKNHVIIVVVALVLTALFTALDNLITPLYYGMNREAFVGYALTSLYALVPQLLCTFITVSLLFRPLIKVLKIAVKI